MQARVRVRLCSRRDEGEGEGYHARVARPCLTFMLACLLSAPQPRRNPPWRSCALALRFRTLSHPRPSRISPAAGVPMRGEHPGKVRTAFARLTHHSSPSSSASPNQGSAGWVEAIAQPGESSIHCRCAGLASERYCGDAIRKTDSSANKHYIGTPHLAGNVF